MIAAQARLAFKFLTLACLLVGAALLTAGLLGTVVPLMRAFPLNDAPPPPAPAPDHGVGSAFRLTMAGVTLLWIAVPAGLAWGGSSLYLRRAGKSRGSRLASQPVSETETSSMSPPPSCQTVLTSRDKLVAAITLGMAAVATVAGIAGYLAGLRRSAPPPLALPAANEVCYVVARAFNSQREEPDLAPFRLPPESFADFLAKLEPFEKAPEPDRTLPIGAAWVIGCDERTWLIEWYWEGQSPLLFSVNGVHYRCTDFELWGPDEIKFGPDKGIQMDIFVRRLELEQRRPLPPGSEPASAPLSSAPGE